MIHIIPSVKTLEIKNGLLKRKSIFYNEDRYDSRLVTALSKLPRDSEGVALDIQIVGDTEEEYELWIREESIEIQAGSTAGAFYAIQTLRQIFKQNQVPCLYIKDRPDFKYRGFYHDITRGKVPTVATIKKLIEQMAYYKLNSLQLYVEHTFEFEEYKKLNEATGYLTAEELKEIDAYCKENFIEFIPSLSTFGHLYELLEQEEYKHLRVKKDFEKIPNFWYSRMKHHTIDPTNSESIEIIKSLIEQYAPHFTSDTFNICCDETFDLKVFDNMGYDSGKLYVGFVRQIIKHVRQTGKKVMMWADVLLHHPEVIDQIPEDICFLNWDYWATPSEDNIMKFKEMGRTQIVCPATWTWNRLCENVDISEKNISLMAEYGFKHGAVGVLNTNWGDWGNPCSLELAMYGMVLGAEKSWSALTEVNDEFYCSVNELLYENKNGIQYLKELSAMHELVNWTDICEMYLGNGIGEKIEFPRKEKYDIAKLQQAYCEFTDKLSGEKWGHDEFRQEMLLAAEGICVIGEMLAIKDNEVIDRLTDTKKWLEKYSQMWMTKNKRSELYKIEEMFLNLSADE